MRDATVRHMAHFSSERRERDKRKASQAVNCELPEKLFTTAVAKEGKTLESVRRRFLEQDGKKKTKRGNSSPTLKPESSEPIRIAHTPSTQTKHTSRARIQFSNKKREKKEKRRRRFKDARIQAQNAVTKPLSGSPEFIDDNGRKRFWLHPESDTVQQGCGSTPIYNTVQCGNTNGNLESLDWRNLRSHLDSSPTPAAVPTDLPEINPIYHGRLYAGNPITATRRTSLPPQPRASPTLPAYTTPAPSILYLLETRATRLQSQLDAFESVLKKTRKKLEEATPSQNLDHSNRLNAKLETLEKTIPLISEHWFEIFLLQHTLYDMVVEEGGVSLDYLSQAEREFADLVEEYDGRLWGIMVEEYPDVVGRTVQGARWN
jgi:hypothetical protein